MKLIAVASTNPIKVRAALAGFKKMFPQEYFQAERVKPPSGVRDQPVTDEETFRGALNRARGAVELSPQADYWIGIEGGVQDCAYPECADELMAFAWVVVIKKDEGRKMKEKSRSPEAEGTLIGKGRTGTFFLPGAVVRLIRQGMELGEADDAVFGRFNSKQENGAVGILTGDVIDRARLYEQAVTLALIPFRNRELYR
jgi:inosine/xanthosine triphosphatase